jgi:hypothetical protein
MLGMLEFSRGLLYILAVLNPSRMTVKLAVDVACERWTAP